jgi:hypothetical protein
VIYLMPGLKPPETRGIGGSVAVGSLNMTIIPTERRLPSRVHSWNFHRTGDHGIAWPVLCTSFTVTMRVTKLLKLLAVFGMYSIHAFSGPGLMLHLSIWLIPRLFVIWVHSAAVLDWRAWLTHGLPRLIASLPHRLSHVSDPTVRNSQPPAELQSRPSFSSDMLIRVNTCDVRKQSAEFAKRRELPQ